MMNTFGDMSDLGRCIGYKLLKFIYILSTI